MRIFRWESRGGSVTTRSRCPLAAIQARLNRGERASAPGRDRAAAALPSKDSHQNRSLDRFQTPLDGYERCKANFGARDYIQTLERQCSKDLHACAKLQKAPI